MLQVHTSLRLDQVEVKLRASANRHGGSVLAVSHVGHLLGPEQDLKESDAVTVTLCFSSLYAPLLRSDIRFAAFLPSRIAICQKGSAAILETISPKEYCHMLHRPEIEPVAASLEEALRAVMEEAARRSPHDAEAQEHRPTEDQVVMRAALPQRIDCHGSKVEELAGTGVHDAQGG
ncbi:MAG TPA: hypothetical protein VMH81_27015 [Bryobacteraceae bacterium]|nr:hypothetical protein [Bryobacteraceae bacterium]